MEQSYNLFFRYSCGALGFLCGFDSEFGTPIVGFGFDEAFPPKEYSFGMAERMAEQIAESGIEQGCAIEVIPAFMFMDHFFGGRGKLAIPSR